MLSIFNWGAGVIVIVASDGTVWVGAETVGEAGKGVRVGKGVKVTTVAVGVIGINVKVGNTVGVTEVGSGIGEAVGVMMIGLPNSLHPRSGAAPVNPVSGLGGMSSPLGAAYCETPLSMAGDVP